MQNFDFYSPTYFAFGKDTENRAGELVKRFGGSKVLIHYGGGSVVRSGLLDRVKASLDKEGISHVELGGVQPNPRSGLVYEGIDLCKKENVDFILAVGGGSTIDSSKAIAAGTVYDGDFWDFYQGKRIEKALPVGTILTIAAAGSEGSPDSVITKEEGMIKRGSGSDLLWEQVSFYIFLCSCVCCELPVLYSFELLLNIRSKTVYLRPHCCKFQQEWSAALCHR